MVASAFARQVTELVDHELTALLAMPPAETADGTGHRTLMRQVKTAVLAYLNPASRWHRSAAALAQVPAWTAALKRRQGPDGLFSSAGNLASPPDSSFTVNDLAVVHRLVSTAALPDATGNTDTLARLVPDLAQLMSASTPALVTGGVHTANHRWELAAALAQLNTWRPDDVVRARADEWLAEGVDIATDGLYSERSPNYAARVTNPCLIVLAEHLQRPDLLDVVHRNLHAHAALIDPAGLVETVHSRRQDQGQRFPAAPFALQYRRFALLHGCPACAATAPLTESVTALEAPDLQAQLLLEPALAEPLPRATAPAATHGLHHFPSAGLVKVSDETSVVTIYGGSDVARVGRVASGLACDPTFLRWRQGRAVLDSLRLSRSFFGLGPFRSDGITVVPPGRQGDQPSYRLQEQVSAAYYQPLSGDRRRGDGSYPLEFEGRFASAMAFDCRKGDEVRLETEILVSTAERAVTVQAEFRGAETSYAFELAFWPGGVLEGVRSLAAADCYELVEGFGCYRVGTDTITFGPGQGSAPERPPRYDPGESYTFLHGTDAKSGPRVYVTGMTPGRCVLLLRAG
ncbi:MAG TPA: hypothetical protein VF635_11855 [Propionibacteriaceae bacterium]